MSKISAKKAYKKKKIYWRFKSHKRLLKNFFDFEFIVDPLMTRDFKIKCDDLKNFEKICNFLNEAKIIDKDENVLSNAFGYIDQISKKWSRCLARSKNIKKETS